MAHTMDLLAANLRSTSPRGDSFTASFDVVGGPAVAVGRKVNITMSDAEVVSIVASLITRQPWKSVVDAMGLADADLHDAYQKKELYAGFTPDSPQWHSAVLKAGHEALKQQKEMEA